VVFLKQPQLLFFPTILAYIFSRATQCIHVYISNA
jgi:hypothetical protein